MDFIATPTGISGFSGLGGLVRVKWVTPSPMQVRVTMTGSPDHALQVGGLAEVCAPSDGRRTRLESFPSDNQPI